MAVASRPKTQESWRTDSPAPTLLARTSQEDDALSTGKLNLTVATILAPRPRSFGPVPPPSPSSAISKRRKKRTLRRRHRQQDPGQIRISIPMPKLSTIFETLALNRHRSANEAIVQSTVRLSTSISIGDHSTLSKLFVPASSASPRSAVRASISDAAPSNDDAAVATQAADLEAAPNVVVVVATSDVPFDSSPEDRPSTSNDAIRTPLDHSSTVESNQSDAGHHRRSTRQIATTSAPSTSSRVSTSLYPGAAPASPARPMPFFTFKSRPQSPTGSSRPQRRGLLQRWKRALKRLGRTIAFSSPEHASSSPSPSTHGKGKARVDDAEVGSVIETLPGVDVSDEAEYIASRRPTLDIRVPLPPARASTPPENTRQSVVPELVAIPPSPISEGSMSVPPSPGIDPSTSTLPTSVATSADGDSVHCSSTKELSVRHYDDSEDPRPSTDTATTVVPSSSPSPMSEETISVSDEPIVASTPLEAILECPPLERESASQSEAESEADDPNDAESDCPPSPKLPNQSLPNHTTPELTTSEPTSIDAAPPLSQPPGLKRASTNGTAPPSRPKGLAHRPSKLLSVKHSRWRGDSTLAHELRMRMFEDTCPSIHVVLEHAREIELLWDEHHAHSVDVEEWAGDDDEEAEDSLIATGWKEYLESDSLDEESLHAATTDDDTVTTGVVTIAHRQDLSFNRVSSEDLNGTSSVLVDTDSH